MIYLWIGLAAWILPGIVLGGRRARAWYAAAFEEHLETVADHNMESRGRGYHPCYLGPYQHGNEKKCYRAMPTHAQAVKRGFVHVLVWPFITIGAIANATSSMLQNASQRLGNASFGSIEKHVREKFNTEREQEKDTFLHKYAEQLRNLHFSYQMVTKYREANAHNHKVDGLAREIMADKDRPPHLTKEAVEQALQTYKRDSEQMKEMEGGAK